MASFGPTAETKQATGALGTISNTAQANSGADRTQGNGILNIGAGNVNSGTNFFNSLLNGNQADTTATLQPSIDQIRGGIDNTAQAINTLTPRGGGRSGTNYGLSYEPQRQIQTLFNSARTNAATALPQIGLQQQGIGTGLLNSGNSALNTGTTASGNLGTLGQQQQQITANMWGGLGKGIFGLATTPFGGGSATDGLFGMLGGR
jgi:hypothetical protein